MADALAMLGAGLGAASLVLQVTDECIKKYHYFTEASRMPESFRYLRVRLQMEQQRFLSFTYEAGLLFADGRLCATLQVNHTVLEDVLVEINSLMGKYEETHGKYSNTLTHDTIDWDDCGEPRTNLTELLCTGEGGISRYHGSPTDQSQGHSHKTQHATVGSRAIDKLRKLRVVLADRKRLAWAATDKESFENLVKKLSDLNSYLITLLDASQSTRLEKAIETSYLEILQLRQDLKDLGILRQALSRDETSDESGVEVQSGRSGLGRLVAKEDEAKRRHLGILTDVKLQRLGIETANTPIPVTAGNATDLLLDISSFNGLICHESYHSHDLEDRRVFDWENQPVWTEWVRTSKVHDNEIRISMLAQLLHGELPASFHVPPCMGYIKCETGDEPTYGLVLKRPAIATSTNGLATLRQLLGQRPKPSLTARINACVTLAECVHSFHSVDWLHKGLRSDNVVNLTQETATPQMNQLYITGFELSRPSKISEMTIKPEDNLLLDLYRHPRAQSGEEDNPYLKCYDIYSLGILLLEIAYWRPIEDILQLDPSNIRRGQVRRVKDQLLSKGALEDSGYYSNDIPSDVGPTRSPYLTKAAEKAGDVYVDMLELCLSADEIERPMYKGESVASVNHRLYTMFKEQILDRLYSMKETLTS